MKLDFNLQNPTFEYITDMKSANKALGILEKEKVVGVDIESTTLDPFTGVLLLLQIGKKDKAFIFDARALDLKNYKRLKEFLENKNTIKILQNGKFDYKHIKHKLGFELQNIYDTMLAEVILNAGIGKAYYGLKYLAQKYLEVELEKETRDTFITMTKSSKINEEQQKYAALDVLILFPIFDAQIQKLKAEKLINIAKLEFAVTGVVGDMELKGLFINKKKWLDIISVLSKKRDEIAREFQDTVKPYFKSSALDLFGNHVDHLNINSQVQLMDLFNNKIGLNLPSTNDGILETVNHPIVKLLRDYRGYEKLVSAFGESLLQKIDKKTGRIHPEFNQLGTATGRFSCNSPNLQQIPRNSQEAPFRECFNPEPGYKLVVTDYASFEMRILADLSKDSKMVKALNDGLDIHSYTAALMFNKQYSKDFKEKFPELRQIAKPIGFGLVYGLGAQGLSGQIGVSTKEAEGYMEKYFNSYPSVKKFLETRARDAVKNGWSITRGGRKRWYTIPEKEDPDYRRKVSRIEREAKNHPIQGTNADALKYALVYISERFKKEGVDGAITHTVHDEIVTEVREDQAQDWAKIQSEEMVRAAKLFIKDVDVVSEPFVSDVWEH